MAWLGRCSSKPKLCLTVVCRHKAHTVVLRQLVQSLQCSDLSLAIPGIALHFPFAIAAADCRSELEDQVSERRRKSRKFETHSKVEIHRVRELSSCYQMHS